MNAGLLAKTAAYAMLCVHPWRFVKTKFHGLPGEGACPVAYPASTTGKRVAYFFRHHCGSHSHRLPAILRWFKTAQCSSGADLCACHAKNACLGSSRYDRRGQLAQAFLKPCETDALVWTNVGALTTTDASSQKILFRLSSRGAQITAQSGCSW